MFHRYHHLSRRGFLTNTISGLTAAGVPGWFASHYAQQGIAQAQEAGKPKSANESLNVGWVGIGSPHSRAFQIYGTSRGFSQLKHVAVCDVDARHLYRAATKFKDENKIEPRQYANYRQLIERDDIDIVVVATPDHWHAQIAIEAMLRGKDIYCEKPLTLTIDEAVKMIEVQKKTGRVLQTGSQQRTEFGGMFRAATEIVRSGAIGKVKTIECRIGANPVSGPIDAVPVPAGLDWEAWLGPTPSVPYRLKKDAIGFDLDNNTPTNCHYNFRWFQAYSGGKMTDWGAHHIDIAQWCLGMDESGPVGVACESMDEPYLAGDGYDWPRDFRVRMTYADGAKVWIMSRGGSAVDGLVNAKGESKAVKPDDNGVLIQGETGTVFVSRGSLLANRIEVLKEPPKLETPLYDRVETNHFGNFLDCVASRKDPICTTAIGGGSVIICHLGVIALQLGPGKELTWDPAAKRFQGTHAELANARIARPRRSGPLPTS